jgi:hypothetical protein
VETFGPLLHPIASTGPSSWILPVEHFIEVPWDKIYGLEREGSEAATLADADGDTVSSIAMARWDARNDQLLVSPGGPRGGGGETLAGSLSVELATGDPPTIEFRDIESGELVHVVEATLPGWEAEDLLRAVRGWGGLDLSFVVGHDGQTSVVRPPWPMSEEWADQIVVSDGWYYTMSYSIGDDFSAQDLHLWRSRDGLDWELVELPADFPRPLDWAFIDAGAEGLGLSVHDFPAGFESVWLTKTGDDWIRADLEGLPTGLIHATDFGWFLESGVVSDDGVTWELLEAPMPGYDPPIGSLHGLLYRGPSEVDGRFVTWFGRLVE